MGKRCLVIGDLNIDLIINDLEKFPELEKEILARNYSVVVGGSGGIFASVLTRLGVVTSIISKIGDDYFGNFLLLELKNFGVDVSNIKIVKNLETGLTVSLAYATDKSQISCLQSVKSLKFDEILFESIQGYKHIHFSSYYMMNNLQKDYVNIVKRIKKMSEDITFSMDTNNDPKDEWKDEIYTILSNIDILFLNKREALGISKASNIEDALKILSESVEKVIIKLGKDGYLARIDGKDYKGSCINVANINFKDAVGAGDNFDAGFLYGYLNNFEISKTLEFANHVSEKSIEYAGGVGNDDKFKKIADFS